MENKVTKPSEAEALAAKKAAKAEAAKKFKERRAAEKAERIEKAKKFIEETKKAGIWDKLSADAKSFIEGLANPVTVSGGSTSTFNKIFGDNPKVGDSISLSAIFAKTLMGKSKVDAYVKKWAAEGTVVEFKQAANILDSTYVIKSIK